MFEGLHGKKKTGIFQVKVQGEFQKELFTPSFGSFHEGQSLYSWKYQENGGEKLREMFKMYKRDGQVCKSIIMVNLNQSFLLQKDSGLICIGAHTYNLKKNENKERQTQNHDHKFSSKVKK